MNSSGEGYEACIPYHRLHRNSHLVHRCIIDMEGVSQGANCETFGGTKGCGHCGDPIG